MDTKWKKLKLILSFASFFLGMTLLIGNVIPFFRLLDVAEEAVRGDRPDYQETGEFRWYISNRLEELLGVTTDGKGWKNYETAYGTAYQTYGDYSGEELDRWMNDWPTTVVQESTISNTYETPAAEGTDDGSWQNEYDWWREYGYDYPIETITSAKYMEEMAKDKNLRYAVVYQQKLVYTNIEAFEEYVGKPWAGEDFYEKLDPKAYNFSLWFNRNGDGKTAIKKDGMEEDIYGNGVYTQNSRWFVPGYTNFNVDSSARDAVVFLAAATEPTLYITGDYSQYGTRQYGGELYYMQERLLTAQQEFRRYCVILGAALVLLLLALLLRKWKRQSDRAIARLLGKLWLEFKVLILLLLPLPAFCIAGAGELREVTYLLRYGGYPEDSFFYLGQAATKSAFLVVCFWLIYLLVLDIKKNHGHQKKPLFDSIRTRDLKYPVQKRLIRRYRLILITGLLSILFGVLLLAGILLRNRYDYLDYGYYGSFLGMSVLLLFVLLLGCTSIGFWYFAKIRRLAVDIGALSDQIAAVKAGNLTEPLDLPADADLRQAAENLNEIQRGMETALREQMHSERMKVELVTNVSHDIKTPLTSIVSYVELLKQEDELPDHVKEFIQILGEKSDRLKTIVQDVFEVSKAASGQLPVRPEELDLGKLLRQTLADMDSQIIQSGLLLKTSLPDEHVLIRADGQRLYRVFQNLIQNALKYSLAGSRIFLTLTTKRKFATVYVKNTSGAELNTGTDFTERFVRGDASRTEAGSGLGLSIAKSFTEACGGSFRIEINADLFTAVVSFPVVQGCES